MFRAGRGYGHSRLLRPVAAGMLLFWCLADGNVPGDHLKRTPSLRSLNIVVIHAVQTHLGGPIHSALNTGIVHIVHRTTSLIYS